MLRRPWQGVLARPPGLKLRRPRQGIRLPSIDQHPLKVFLGRIESEERTNERTCVSMSSSKVSCSPTGRNRQRSTAFDTYAHCTMVGRECGHSSKISGAMPMSYTNPICLAPKQVMRTPGVPSSGGSGMKLVTPPSMCMLPRKLLVSLPSIQRGIWQDVMSASIKSSRSEKSLTSWPVGVPKLPNIPRPLLEALSTELTATNVLPVHRTCASSGRADWRNSSRRMPSLPRVPCRRQSSIRSSQRSDTLSIERPLFTHAAMREPADAPGTIE